MSSSRGFMLPRTGRSARLSLAALASSAVMLTGLAAPAQAHTVTAPVTSHPVLRYDDTGFPVKYLQYKLGVGKSGRFGRVTEAAVKNVQRRHGLAVTGAVPSSVWTALGVRKVSERASRSEPRSLTPGSAAFGERVMALARVHSGKPYSYGGNGPSSFDCSGLVNYVYDQVGYDLPRTSSQIRDYLPRLSSSYVRPGDLVFVHNGGGGRVGHVGIYAGNGYWFEASNPSRPVGLNKAWSSAVSYGRVR